MMLMRFKDNTFVWLSHETGSYISSIMSKKNAMAFGIWNLKIPKTEVNMAINNLDRFGDVAGKYDNVAIFGDDVKLFLYTTKHGEAK